MFVLDLKLVPVSFSFLGLTECDNLTNSNCDESPTPDKPSLIPKETTPDSSDKSYQQSFLARQTSRISLYTDPLWKKITRAEADVVTNSTSHSIVKSNTPKIGKFHLMKSTSF